LRVVLFAPRHYRTASRWPLGDDVRTLGIRWPRMTFSDYGYTRTCVE